MPHYDDELGGDVGEGFYGGVGGGGRLDDRYDEADLEDAAALADLPDDVRELFKYIDHYEPQVCLVRVCVFVGRGSGGRVMNIGGRSGVVFGWLAGAEEGGCHVAWYQEMSACCF